METRAKGKGKNKNLTSDPDGDNLHEYWTQDPEGLAKWKPLPHPWTALYNHLKKYITNDNIAKATASKWYREVFGHMPNQDKKDGGGKSNKFGPGRSDGLAKWLGEWRATGVGGSFSESAHPRDPAGKFAVGGGKVAGKPVDKKKKPTTGVGHAGPARKPRPKPGTGGIGKTITKTKKPAGLSADEKKQLADLERQIALDSEAMTAAQNSGSKEAAAKLAAKIAAAKSKINRLQEKAKRGTNPMSDEMAQSRTLEQWCARWEQRKKSMPDFDPAKHPRGPGGKFASKGGGEGSGGGGGLPDISHLKSQGVSLDPKTGTIKKSHYERNKMLIKDTKMALDFEKSKPEGDRNQGLIDFKAKQIDEWERENEHYEKTNSSKGKTKGKAKPQMSDDDYVDAQMDWEDSIREKLEDKGFTPAQVEELEIEAEGFGQDFADFKDDPDGYVEAILADTNINPKRK